MSRTESVSSQLSGKIDVESVSSGDVSEPISIPVKEESESRSNHLNNNVIAEQTPNGVPPVETPTPAVPKTVESASDADKADVQKLNEENANETTKPVESSKKNDTPSQTTGPTDSTTPNENGAEVVSIDSSSEVASEEPDQVGELPTSSSSTPPVAVSNKEPESSSQLGVNACASVSDQSTANTASGIAADTSNEPALDKPAETEQSSSKTDKEIATADNGTSTENDTSKKVTKGTSFNSLNKIPVELAAANKAAKESTNISDPIPEEEQLPTDEALVIDLLDEVLSSDLANEVTKPTGSRPASVTSDLSTTSVSLSSNQPPTIGESPEEVFADCGDEKSKLESQNTTASKPTSEMNGNAPRLLANGTQVFLCAFSCLLIVD